ncbi:glycosyltransferase [Marinicrinis sediminis]|uniref:Glycosyltransferase n=1 Tax=Marinicrinis sediminis TaxID=1652465 RepID=A0ABW5R948_9BACL
MSTEAIKVGYLGRQWYRINQRVVEKQWLDYVGAYIDVVTIPPTYIRRLFGASFETLNEQLPASLDQVATELTELCDKYEIQMLYVNTPTLIPYLMMARDRAKLDLGILFIAHCVGSTYWMKLWMSVAPWITPKDVLLVSTASCKRALTHISPVYEQAELIPLGIHLQEMEAGDRQTRPRSFQMLSIGRIEDVKNLHVLLRCFSSIREQVEQVRLVIAGEFTGDDENQVASYKQELDELITQHQLQAHVQFTGAVVGEEKDRLFRESDMLINLSTDVGETFGYNLIEAKTWGLPVVCTAWNGFMEVVRHGEDGYLVDCDWTEAEPVIDEQQVIDYSVQLLKSDERYAQFSRQALRYAANYDYRTLSPKIREAVERAVALPWSPAAWQMNDEAITSTQIKDLTHLYRLDRLARLPYLHDTVVSIIPTDFAHTAGSLTEWYERVKPIVGHYAGRSTAYKEAAAAAKPHA